MRNFRQVDRETGYLLPPSVDEWLPERHLARSGPLSLPAPPHASAMTPAGASVNPQSSR